MIYRKSGKCEGCNKPMTVERDITIAPPIPGERPQVYRARRWAAMLPFKNEPLVHPECAAARDTDLLPGQLSML